MPLLTYDDAVLITEPFREAWLEAHQYAWRLWMSQVTENPEFVKPLTSSDRYVILHRHITDQAARRLDGHLVTADGCDFFAQRIGNRTLVRFKHLDSDLRPQNYPTDQQKHLDQQEYTERLVEQLSLNPVEEPPTVVTVGYTLTPGEDELSRVVIICRNPKLQWCIDLLDTAGLGGGNVDVKPFPSMPPTPPRITSTRRKQDEAEGNEG